MLKACVEFGQMFDEPEMAPVESGIPTLINIEAVSEHPLAKLATLKK